MRPIFKKIALAAPLLGIAAVFSAASAQEVAQAQMAPQPINVTPAQCIDSKGRDVEYVAVPPGSLRGALARSLWNQEGLPIVAVDTETLAKTAPSFQRYVLRHECSHHARGHVAYTYESGIAFLMPIMVTPKKKAELAELSMKMESEADCDAVIDVAREGAGHQDFNQIAAELVRYAHHLPHEYRDVKVTSAEHAQSLWLQRLSQCLPK